MIHHTLIPILEQCMVGDPLLTPFISFSTVSGASLNVLQPTIMPQFMTVFADPLKRVSERHPPTSYPTAAQYLYTRYPSFTQYYVYHPSLIPGNSPGDVITSSTTNLQHDVCHFTCDKA